MSDPFLGEIRIFAGTYAPHHWAFCHGQLMPISDNPPLFSLLGTSFGGNGRTDFALPDFRGRACVGTGAMPGGGQFFQGQKQGREMVSLTLSELPHHTHSVRASTHEATSSTPIEHFPAKPTGERLAYAEFGETVALAEDTLDIRGSGEPISNVQPSLAVQYIISLQGVYPERQ